MLTSPKSCLKKKKNFVVSFVIKEFPFLKFLHRINCFSFQTRNGIRGPFLTAAHLDLDLQLRLTFSLSEVWKPLEQENAVKIDPEISTPPLNPKPISSPLPMEFLPFHWTWSKKGFISTDHT